ncbi:24_t:CDS:1 [Gigaspora margarita]|uniref:24_t:CDS:1 n=1 Tax=Gigaspora margarita TaxID=4874 RepID=A0ABN7UWV1_GIGMA|nr:24_t:CDS:1 [Gigaspora margarita]
MYFLHQERHQRKPQQRQQRGPYVTKACTNCRQKHAKCTGEVPCERCTRLNLVCTFSASGKKRGPKKNNKLLEEVYSLDNLRNDFDRTHMQFFVISDAVQGHASTQLSPTGYSQQPYDIDGFTHYSASYEEQNVPAFQEVCPVLYQASIDTGNVMPNNNLLDNAPTNNIFDYLFFDGYYMLPSDH